MVAELAREADGMTKGAQDGESICLPVREGKGRARLCRAVVRGEHVCQARSLMRKAVRHVMASWIQWEHVRWRCPFRGCILEATSRGMVT